MKLEFTLNGSPVSVETPPDRRLIDLLREDFGLTGTKEGCGTGECGACTVRADGETKLACLMLAAQAQGREIVTIEGMSASPEDLHPVQEAFVEKGAVQCGFCTPGMVMSLSTYLDDHPEPDEDGIREAVSGNLCRCTGYQKIVDAGLSAARKDKGGAVADVVFPKTLDEASTILSTADTPALLAGGTDLLVRMRHGGATPRTLVSLDRVGGMQEILEGEAEILIRGAAPLARIMAHPAIRTHAAVLCQAISVLGSPQIRNMGTIGGNIMTASPAGDTLPPLYALDAFVDLAGPDGMRRMALTDFITGPGQTAAATGEILWQVGFSKPDPKACHCFEKVGQRTALSISMVSLAALFSLDENGCFSRVRLAWGSVGPTIIQSPETEGFLIGKNLSAGTLAGAGKLARAAVSPISDVRATEAYRREVSGRLLLRLDETMIEKRRGI